MVKLSQQCSKSKAEVEQKYTYLFKGDLFIDAFVTPISPYDVGHNLFQLLTASVSQEFFNLDLC